MKRWIETLVLLTVGLIVGLAQPAIALTNWDDICNDNMASHEAKEQAGCYEGGQY